MANAFPECVSEDPVLHGQFSYLILLSLYFYFEFFLESTWKSLVTPNYHVTLVSSFLFYVKHLYNSKIHIANTCRYKKCNVRFRYFALCVLETQKFGYNVLTYLKDLVGRFSVRGHKWFGCDQKKKKIRVGKVNSGKWGNIINILSAATNTCKFTLMENLTTFWSKSKQHLISLCWYTLGCH
jgi:hypothetical protein